MRVIVVGSGGREHALAWKIARSPLVHEVIAVPGNPGTAREQGVRNAVAHTCDELIALAQAESVSLVVFGPEGPLVEGWADRLRDAGFDCVGPGAAGAMLEGSKAWCKDFFHDAGVPTARYAITRTPAEIHRFVDHFDGAALVVKADGLAAGKGVIVCDDREQARLAALDMLESRPFGDASSTVVLEERLEGVEVSYMVLTDGQRFLALPTSQDHKRLLDGDQGPNTGGMGAFSPAEFLTAEDIRRIEAEVIEPCLAELRHRGIEYRGFLYAGIMLTTRGPMALEINVRLGDPETQVLMMALADDLVPALIEAANGDLQTSSLATVGAAAVVVMAAEGYPVKPVTGAAIHGLDAEFSAQSRVFHAGTRQVGPEIYVAGGRVLGVAGSGSTPVEAIRTAYEAVSRIAWPGAQYRTDIGRSLRS